MFQIPPPVIPERWLRIAKETGIDPSALDRAAQRIRAELLKHPQDSSCGCPTIAAIESLAVEGYEVVPFERVFAEIFRRYVRVAEEGPDAVDVAIAEALQALRHELLPWLKADE